MKDFQNYLFQTGHQLAFLNESKWILSGFSKWIVSNPGVLNAVDFLNTWGLIAIGLGLILGLFTKPAAISGAILLFIYYLNNPPLIGLEYSVPTEGSYLIISKTLIESMALVLLAVFPSGSFAGLDMLVQQFRESKKIKGREEIMGKDIEKNSENKNEMANQSTIKRRTLLKALVGIPVLGVFAIELFRKYTYDQEKKNRVIKRAGTG